MQFKHDKDLETLRLEYIDKIDLAAGASRTKFLTVSAGQELTYKVKLEEALRYKDNPIGNFPWLDALEASLGANKDAIADNIISTSNNWTIIGSRIEALRLKAKEDTRNATTNADFYSIFDQYLKDLP